MTSTGQEVEVRLIPNHKKVEVYMLKASKNRPAAVSLTFYDQSMHTKTIELKAIETNDLGGPQYQGSINPWMGSYVGLSIQIPLQSNPSSIYLLRENPPSWDKNKP